MSSFISRIAPWSVYYDLTAPTRTSQPCSPASSVWLAPSVVQTTGRGSFEASESLCGTTNLYSLFLLRGHRLTACRLSPTLKAMVPRLSSMNCFTAMTQTIDSGVSVFLFCFWFNSKIVTNIAEDTFRDSIHHVCKHLSQSCKEIN